MFTRKNTLKEIVTDPRIKPYADRIVVGLDLSQTPFYEMTIEELSRQRMFHGYTLLNGFNRLLEAVEEGPFCYPLYSEEEIRKDPKKAEACFMLFPSMDPDADEKPFLICVPGGGNVQIWNMSEGFPIANHYNQLGYHMVVLNYRYGGEKLYCLDWQPSSQQLSHPARCSPRDPSPRILERYFLREACLAFRAAIAVCDEAQLLPATYPYRHVPQVHAPAVVDVYPAAADRAACLCRFLPALKHQYRFCPFLDYRVCFALVPLTFDADCDILFSEHGLTSFLCVSQLQLEVFHAPFVYLVSVNPTTFRDEPFVSLLGSLFVRFMDC